MLKTRMVFSNPYLVEYSTNEDVPTDCYLLYDMKDCKIYALKRNQYVDFVKCYFNQKSENLHLTMDLAFAQYHSLMLDIDLKYTGQYPQQDILKYINEHLKPIISSFFFQIKCFTVILCMRCDGGGIHVHFPEITINHDDYIMLCEQLQPQLEYQQQTFSLKLDIVKNFNLSNSSKKNTDRYRPTSVQLYENGKISVVPMHNQEEYTDNKKLNKKPFKITKSNGNSVYRELLNLPFDTIQKKASFYSMPVVIRDNFFQIGFPTTIGNKHPPNYQFIAHFTYMDNYNYLIAKAFNFIIYPLNQIRSPVYKYILSKRLKMSHFQTENHALKAWFNHCPMYRHLKEDMFLHVNKLLVEDNPYFLSTSHPLKTSMEFNNGCYFFPIFYALCNHLNLTSSVLAKELLSIITPPDLVKHLEKLLQIKSDIIKDISNDFTLNTILYCGSNLSHKMPKFSDKLDSIILDNLNAIEASLTEEDLQNIILRIIHRYIPIIVATMQNSCSNASRYMWNNVQEQWQAFTSENEVKNMIVTISTKIQNKFTVDDDIYNMIKNLRTGNMTSPVMTETNMDRLKIRLNQHKWHLKTQAGVLDLLTGHVGGIVPEFYLSDVYLGVPFDREQLMKIRNDRRLSLIVNTLTSKKFFKQYLKNLFLDITSNFFDTLKETAISFDIWEENDPWIDSIFHFYIHICKYMSFEFDALDYMLNVLASMLIATNYSRKFYIMQGITGNGKSKLFEIINKLFDGYSQPIRNVNLQPGKGIAAQPEMAASIFCKRIVAVEELSGVIDENLIKELTGNSYTSFRKLYENNQGGIPTAKLLASTNKPPKCTASVAFSRRLIAIPFDAEFVEFLPNVSTSYQVRNNKFEMKKDDNLVNRSYQGLFILIYIRLFENMSMEDGYLHIQNEPDVISEFTNYYMHMMSVYMQFKQYADVQLVSDTSTTEQELISAIRQFLIDHKISGSIEYQQIMKEFNEEFQEFRKTIEQNSLIYKSDLFNDSEDEEEEIGPPAKRAKFEFIVLYDGIAIKNLKKSRV